jgi:hypothetical protein
MIERSLCLKKINFGVHVLRFDVAFHWSVPASSGFTLRVKGTLVGGDRKMRVIRGVQEDSATLKLPNDGAGPYRRTTHLIVEMVATGLTKQKQNTKRVLGTLPVLHYLFRGMGKISSTWSVF